MKCDFYSKVIPSVAPPSHHSLLQIPSISVARVALGVAGKTVVEIFPCQQFAKRPRKTLVLWELVGFSTLQESEAIDLALPHQDFQISQGFLFLLKIASKGLVLTE